MQFHWPGFDSLEKLSAEETAELAARMADLTKAGLPLGEGLRALAGELSGRRLRRVLRALADQLDAGADLAVAVESQSARLPTCLRGLVLAGLRSGRLAETLEEYVDLQRSQSELRRRLWLSLAYPLMLLLCLTALVVVVRLYLLDEYQGIAWGFGVQLPAVSRLLMDSSGCVMWSLIFMSGTAVAIPIALRLAPRAMVVAAAVCVADGRAVVAVGAPGTVRPADGALVGRARSPARRSAARRGGPARGRPGPRLPACGRGRGKRPGAVRKHGGASPVPRRHDPAD